MPGSAGLQRGLATFARLLTLLLVFAAGNSGADMSGLIVYGSDFGFVVREPQGWKGDSEAASNYGGNIVFYRRSETVHNARTLILINVSTKSGENTAEDLEYDMTSYRRRFPNILFKDLEVSSPRYGSVAKVFYVPYEFYEYVTYLNPGPSSHLLLSASMNTQRRPATQEELAAYQSVIDSLALMDAPSKPALR